MELDSQTKAIKVVYMISTSDVLGLARNLSFDCVLCIASQQRDSWFNSFSRPLLCRRSSMRIATVSPLSRGKTVDSDAKFS